MVTLRHGVQEWSAARFWRAILLGEVGSQLAFVPKCLSQSYLLLEALLGYSSLHLEDSLWVWLLRLNRYWASGCWIQRLKYLRAGGLFTNIENLCTEDSGFTLLSCKFLFSCRKQWSLTRNLLLQYFLPLVKAPVKLTVIVLCVLMP